MHNAQLQTNPSRKIPTNATWLIVVGVAMTATCWQIMRLSAAFVYGSDQQQRPIVIVLIWFTTLFALYLLGWRIAIACKSNRRLVAIVIGFACLMRFVMLGSEPIQEVDIYRYLWDGAVTATGVSPYKFTPEEVIAGRERTDLPEDWARLVAKSKSQPAMGEIIGRVHFPQIPTVYPPVSQIGFWLVHSLTPESSTLETRLRIMRIWLVGCDLLTLVVLLLILKRLKMHAGFSVLYAWCPLILKEIANSGHLDSMAVLLTTCGIYCSVRLYQRAAREDHPGLLAVVDATFAAVALVLGVGAKLYPVVLYPWFICLVSKRIGAKALVPAVVLLLATWIVLRPMFVVPASEQEATLRPPSDGIKTFLRYWEMNDFIFLCVVENLRATPEIEDQPWFVVLPERLRSNISGRLTTWLAMPDSEATFLAARVITMGVFCAIGLFLIWNAWRQDDISVWLRAAFLTLAWFWMLSPTQNPWYWIWAMPLLPFARYRSWYLISGLAMAYYLRFWFQYHFADAPVAGTTYPGTLYFDFVVTWFEFGPWFLLLTVEAWARRTR